MRRLLLIIMMFSFLISANSYVIASDESIAYDLSAIETVKTLGFMVGDDEGNFNPEQNITRSEFARVICNLLAHYPDLSNGAPTSFYDVTSSHWAGPCVNYVYSLGLMKGDGSGYFHPEKDISVSEALKVLITVMEYDFFAENNGGYPTGYIAQAQNLKLLKRLNISDYNRAITRGEVAVLIDSCLDIPIYHIYEYGDNNISIDFDKDNTLLSKYHDIYIVEGIVTSNNFTSVNSLDTTPDNKISIDGEVYNTKIDDTNDVLGLNVKAYYHKTQDDILTIIHIEQNENKTIRVKDEDFEKLDNYVFTYYENSTKRKKLNIEPNTNIIWNNQYYCRAVNFDSSELLTINGYIDFISNDSDESYEIIKVSSYETAIVDSVSNDGLKIASKYNTLSMDLEESRYIIKRDDEVIKGSDILSGEVLIVAQSKGFESNIENSPITINVCTNTVSGTVTGIGDSYVTIMLKDGTKLQYAVSNAYVSKNNADIKVNDSGIFYLHNNKIVFLEDSSSGKIKFGYLIKPYETSGMDKQIKVKIFTAAGQATLYDVKDKVVFDGERMKGNDMYLRFKELCPDNEFGMIIRYSLNDDNLVTMIDTPNPNSDGDPDELTLLETNHSGGMRYQGMAGLLVSNSSSERFLLNGDVPVFEIPANATSDDDYTIYSSGYFREAEYYGDSAKGQKLILCNVKDGTPAAVVMEVTAAAGNTGSIVTTEDPAGIIKSKYVAIDEDGTVGTKFVIDLKGKDVELFTTESSRFKIRGSDAVHTADDFNFGDIVMYDADKHNKINVLLKINTEYIPDLEHGEYSVAGMSGYAEFIMGSVRKKTGTLLELDVNKTPNLYINAKSPYVAIVDVTRKTVTKAKITDIWASDSDLEADKIFARVRFGRVDEIAIYRK